MARSAWSTSPSERALDGLDLVALDDVALLDVLVVGEGHTAFLARENLARFVLEALERRQLAFVDDDVVADETHLGAAAHDAFRHAAAGDLADFRDGEDFEDFRVAEEF